MQPTVPASLLLGMHLRLPTAFLFLLPSWGIPLSLSPVPRLSAPSPVSRRGPVHSQPASLPGDFPVCLFRQASEGHERRSRASAKCSDLEGFNCRRNLVHLAEKKWPMRHQEIFNTLRVICPPITRSRFSATCTQCCNHPETFSALSCDPATRLFTCLPQDQVTGFLALT